MSGVTVFDSEAENVLVQVPLLDDDNLYPKEQPPVDLIAHERQRVALPDEFAHCGGCRGRSDAQAAHERRGFAPRAETMTLRPYPPTRPHSRIRLNGYRNGRSSGSSESTRSR